MVTARLWFFPQDNCDCVSLKCYTEELKMVLDELQIADNTVDCILDFNEALAPPLVRSLCAFTRQIY